MKMQNIRLLITNAVNLQSYSTSPGFLGYFERAGKYVDGMAEAAVSLFFDVFGEEIDGLVLVSSLHANTDELGRFGDAKLDERDHRLVDYLCLHNALHRFSYRTRFGTAYESSSYARAIEEVTESLASIYVSEIGQDVLRQLLLARMLVYGLRGHCFLVSKSRGLIFYPHEDTGFGIIAFGTIPDREFASKFLNRASSLKRFRSIPVG
ncbi:hypothetical protein [Massilia endophytica]|uniref:hypothetical protein n=1 Tax=Massilia endophytica TaxID=2899220 RepID=UPI001E46F8BE|nr:hypothetical protein [Massilia endophytica]UGQ48733.1 hypothetical protein LSQ66_09810 [Massilia endophytica]